MFTGQSFIIYEKHLPFEGNEKGPEVSEITACPGYGHDINEREWIAALIGLAVL
jgi:hypothetical protein